MGKFIAVLLAFILISSECQIFRDPVVTDGALGPSYIFLIAISLLLYDLRLYPKNLRKLDTISQIVFEFFIAMFAMENILLDFWFPIENGARSLPKQAAEKLEEVIDDEDEHLEFTCNYLRSTFVTIVISYTLSLFFLFAVLHAIRAVDFRALEEGPCCFFEDIAHRGRRFTNKRLRALGCGRKRVKIKESDTKLPIINTAECRKIKKETNKNKRDKDKKDKDLYCPPDFDNFEDLNLDDDIINDGSIKFNDYDIPEGDDLLLCDEIN